MSILFVNGSPEKNGNTAALAKVLLAGKDYETLNLNDYRINNYGQTLPGDQFDEVLERVKQADTVVFGSPVYWHNIGGALRNFLDRTYGPLKPHSLHGKLFFLFQGAAPEKWMLDAGEYTMKRFASLCGYEYEGMATDTKEAEELRSRL